MKNLNITLATTIIIVLTLLSTSCGSRSGKRQVEMEKRRIEQAELKKLREKFTADSIANAELEAEERETARLHEISIKIDSLKKFGYEKNSIKEFEDREIHIDDYTIISKPFNEYYTLLFEGNKFVNLINGNLKKFYSNDEVFLYWTFAKNGDRKIKIHSKSYKGLIKLPVYGEDTYVSYPVGKIKNDFIYRIYGETSDLIYKGKQIVINHGSSFDINSGKFIIEGNKTFNEDGTEDSNYDFGPDWTRQESNLLASQLMAINNNIELIEVLAIK
ncbi:MAG: hypothetical protein N4A44_03150 [Alphaproteobacteria bacterium]|jgi:hypothetical protein|nr:hypothetical protein [Alphaproteobacteria bacterium]